MNLLARNLFYIIEKICPIETARLFVLAKKIFKGDLTLERRKFLMLFGVGTVASYLPVAIAACSSLLKPDAASAQSNGFLVVGPVADLDNAGQILGDTEIGFIAVVRSPDNPQNLAAVDPTCTHNGCATGWDSSNENSR
jgi:cytochrome b6-f complex iron-sulfur subunit